jgi:hypothetical protein
MKLLLLLGLALFATSACARVATPDASANLTTADDGHPNDDWNRHFTGDDLTGPITAADDDPWSLSVAHGTKLLQGMQGSDADADAAILYNLGSTAESPSDGDLINKLKEWGYNDDTDALAKKADPECNFDNPNSHMLKKAFADLSISLKPKSQGGPNQCFQIEHYDSPAVKLGDDGKMPEKVLQRHDVCGKEYRIINAEHTIGINAEARAVYAMQLSSAAKAARRLWKRATLADKLPAIRSVSDIAWAFWNRVHFPPPPSKASNTSL